MKIHLASDHAGYELKAQVRNWLESEGHEVIDHGAETLDPDDSYIDFIFPAAYAVADDPGSMGIIFGGSGQGEAIAANRVHGVRAAVYYGSAQAITAVDASGRMSDDIYEIVRLSRMHNDANVLSIGARFVSFEEVKKVATIWLNEPFSGLDRYANRNVEVDKR